MKFYKHRRFIALSGKIPAYRGNWRVQTIAWAAAKRRLEEGKNAGFVIPENMIVIDIDPRNGGAESYEKLLDATGLPPLETEYPAVITGGGGLHLYMTTRAKPESIAAHSADFPGIDIKKYGGYVVSAGSIHPETHRRYSVFSDIFPTEIYPEVLKIFAKSPIQKLTDVPPGTWGRNDLAEHLSKLDPTNYRHNDDWFPLLCSAHYATNGAGVEEFIEWSIQDPQYTDHGETIRARWNSLRQQTATPITQATILGEIAKNQIDDLSGPLGFETDMGGYAPFIEADIPFQVSEIVLREHILKACKDGRFWEFRKTHWQPIHMNMIKRYIYTAYISMEGNTKSIASVLGATIGLVEARAAVDHTPAGLPRDPSYSIINVQNGELWVSNKTGHTELRAHSPESNQVSCLPIYYDPGAKAPRFERFLAEIFPRRPDTVRHLIEILGYTIQARKNLATWVLFHGRGANGKTVLLSLISALLGEAALEKPIGSISTERNNHALADLPGKLALIDDDVSATTLLPDGELKMLSENKSLQANPKNAQTFKFESCIIPILSANNFPTTKDLSDGLRRRAQVFLFKRQFATHEQDSDLSDFMINNEISGVLNILLEGLRRVRARGRWDEPKDCLEARNQWYASNNTIVDFIAYGLVKTRPENVALYEDVWRVYQTYTIEEGIRRPLSRARLRDQLTAAGVKIIERHGRLHIVGYRPKNMTQKN